MDISTLAQLVSIGTLFVFYMVDLGVLVRRFCCPGSSDWRGFGLRYAAMLAFNIGAILQPCDNPVVQTTVNPRYTHIRQEDISICGRLCEGQVCTSPLKGCSVSGYLVNWMAFWAPDRVLISRFYCSASIANGDSLKSATAATEVAGEGLRMGSSCTWLTG